MHPDRVMAAIQDALGPDSIIVADGGDSFSFARVSLSAPTWFDPDPSVVWIGTPFGIGASLASPGRDVFVVTGDGAFGFNAMEIDTAVRHNASVLIVVLNNGAWQIEVHDQIHMYGKVIGTRLQLQPCCDGTRIWNARRASVKAADLPSAIARALERRPALLDVVVTPEAVSSDSKMASRGCQTATICCVE